MKTHSLVIACAGLSLVGCTFRAVRLETAVPSADTRELARLRVGVHGGAGADSATAAEFTSDLRRTGLFGEVIQARSSRGLDLIATVQRVGGVARCGTPDMLSRVSLGLWHGSTRYFHDYQVEFRGASGSAGFSFDRRYAGTVASGLLSLPRRAWSRWSRPRRIGAPATVISALGADLSRSAPELLQLASDPIERASPTPANQSLHRTRPCGPRR